MNIFKLIKILLDVDNWELEYFRDIVTYKHVSGYYTYVGYIYFNKDGNYEVPFIIHCLTDLLFKRLIKKVKTRIKLMGYK